MREYPTLELRGPGLSVLVLGPPAASQASCRDPGASRCGPSKPQLPEGDGLCLRDPGGGGRLLSWVSGQDGKSVFHHTTRDRGPELALPMWPAVARAQGLASRAEN